MWIEVGWVCGNQGEGGVREIEFITHRFSYIGYRNVLFVCK